MSRAASTVHACPLYCPAGCLRNLQRMSLCNSRLFMGSGAIYNVIYSGKEMADNHILIIILLDRSPFLKWRKIWIRDVFCYFKKGERSGFEMCFAIGFRHPRPGPKTRLGCSVKKFKPHFIYMLCASDDAPGFDSNCMLSFCHPDCASPALRTPRPTPKLAY